MTPHQEHLGVAGFAMAWGILGRLHSKGLITTEETIDLLDGGEVLGLLENLVGVHPG